MEQGRVDLQVKDNAAYITFSHPNSNSLPGDLLRELTEAIKEAGANPEAKVIVLRSEGEKVFCSGASFDELVSITDSKAGHRFFSGFANLINAMRRAPKFIVTLCQGKAVGGGVGILAASDYVFAHQFSAIKLSELAVGLGPFVVGPAVERKIGKAHFAQMSIDFEWYGSDWALDKGLFSQVHPDLDTLNSAANAFVKKLTQQSPEAMAELKQVLWEGTEDWDNLLTMRAEISGRLVLSDFTKNYIREFKKDKA